jgi:hypothetical protein
MPKLYYFHIQLTKDSDWIKEIGVSLAHVMADIATHDTVPYCFFKTEY